MTIEAAAQVSGPAYVFVCLFALYVIIWSVARGGKRRRKVRRKTVRLSGPRHASAWQRRQLYRQHRSRCFYCKAQGRTTVVHHKSRHRGTRFSDCDNCGEIDHIVPHSRGGPTTMDNLTLACWKCNRSKGALTPWEWKPDVFPAPARPRTAATRQQRRPLRGRRVMGGNRG